MISRPLAAAVVLGIGVPAVVLVLFQLQGWDLPTWLAVALPIILFGSLRGTIMLFAWKAIRRAFKAWRSKRSMRPDDQDSEIESRSGVQR